MIRRIIRFSIFPNDKPLRTNFLNPRCSNNILHIVSIFMHRKLIFIIEKFTSITVMWISYPFCYSIKRRLNINCRREFHTCLRINIIDARNFRTRN